MGKKRAPERVAHPPFGGIERSPVAPREGVPAEAPFLPSPQFRQVLLQPKEWVPHPLHSQGGFSPPAPEAPPWTTEEKETLGFLFPLWGPRWPPLLPSPPP